MFYRPTPSFYSCVRQRVPLFSTALMHFSTKRGTVVFSCAHSVAKWQPNTLSMRKKCIIMNKNVGVVRVGGYFCSFRLIQNRIIKRSVKIQPACTSLMSYKCTWSWITSNVSFLLDGLKRGTFHEELHQLGPNPFWVCVPRRAGRMCDTRPIGWNVSDIYRHSACRSNWVDTDDVNCSTYIDAYRGRFQTGRPEPRRCSRSCRTSLHPPRQKGGPGTPGGHQ